MTEKKEFVFSGLVSITADIIINAKDRKTAEKIAREYPKNVHDVEIGNIWDCQDILSIGKVKE